MSSRLRDLIGSTGEKANGLHHTRHRICNLRSNANSIPESAQAPIRCSVRPPLATDAAWLQNIKARADGYTASYLPVKLMIAFMYRIPARQVIGGPRWLEDDRYDVPYFCWMLGQLLQDDERPVIDLTGLTGFYDFNLSYLPEGLTVEEHDKLSGKALDRSSIPSKNSWASS